jgi:hypothetical protein
LIGSEGAEFGSTGEAERGPLRITAVHPLRAKAVRELVARTGRDFSLVKGLIARQQFVETVSGDEKFHRGKLPARIWGLQPSATPRK